MNYPTLDQVKNANREQLAEWYRFLPSPGWNLINAENFYEILKNQTEIIDEIVKRFGEMGGFTSQISKRVGWDKR